MNISDIQLLFDYNYWANRLILAKAAGLNPEQLMQENGFPWGNLRGTLIHMLDAENVWRHLCNHNRMPAQTIAESVSFLTFDSLVTYWENEEREMRAYLNSLEDKDMENIVRYNIPEGVRERVLWHCLVHLVNHGTQHRSECAVMLTNAGRSPGDIDMTRFLNQRAGIE